MTDFMTVKLELVRPGPPHNQLLSPLTLYMALCGEGSPVTFHIELEHHQMLSRLERLRYVTRQGAGLAGVPDRMREAALLEIGADVKRVLGEIRTLLAEIARARASHPERDGRDRAVHLRLVLGGSELSLIPFEMAFAPQAFPGEGLEFSLQLAMPVVPTRETRTSRQLPVAWDCPVEPRILFVSAAPEGLGVPAEAHIHALRAAVEPWVKWPKGGARGGTANMERDRLPLVRERLRLLVNASVEDIRERCARERFTHVHILAHGDTYEAAGEQRFGVALCESGDRTRKDVVSGGRLAEALQPPSDDRAWRSSPLVVTLATCDSGNQRSVLVPGGSIAHDLHVAGIPWVFASQFPLTIPGSVRMAETLYPLLLRGDDPREALYEVRRQLHMTAKRDHDWAALAVYASVPDNFDDQIYHFFESQTRHAIDVILARADDLASQTGEADTRDEEMRRQLGLAREALDLWRARLPDGSGEQDKTRRAECYGMHGSVFKRIAVLRMGENDATVRALLGDALAYYRKAMNEFALAENKHHWVATQALSIGAVLGAPPDPRNFGLARELAARDLGRASGEALAWAHGTLAELEMLGPYHTGGAAPATLTQTVADHCKAIVELMGTGSFAVESTRRQFQRYLVAWQSPNWAAIARAAVDALSSRA
jgi:hypothetical protein